MPSPTLDNGQRAIADLCVCTKVWAPTQVLCVILNVRCADHNLPPTKEKVYVFARICLSVCLLARLLKNVCMDLDEILHVDRRRDMDDELINF